MPRISTVGAANLGAFGFASGGAPAGYNLTKSLRFRASASAYLNRTFGTPTNNLKWTWSGWVKRGALGTEQNILAAGTLPNDDQLEFPADNTLAFYLNNGASYYIKTNQVFRDPSAWYHIVLAFDSANATASNRILLYVNGVQVTSFSTANYPTQNYSPYINSAIATRIGARSNISVTLDGYLTEVNFIDGQALTPTSFGSTNSTTGVWQPIAYTGTYGTNGFYLKFTDTSSTAALGTDYSGNSNTWTVNNISLTAGSTYDSMTDVPTLTSATTANYAVMNPLVARNANAQTLSNGNLTSTAGSSSSAGGTSLSTIGMSSGKWYAEYKFSTLNSSGGSSFGIVTSAWNIGASADDYYWSSAQGYGYSYSSGKKQNNSAETTYGATYTTNDVIGIAFDATNGTLEFYKNGTSQGVAFTGIPAGIYYFALYSYNSDVAQANFGQQPFAYTPPTGFVALNTYNLPTSTIVAGNKVMDATTYTGNGSTQTITNTGGFKPDLVWYKGRSNTFNHGLFDSIRGTTKQLFSNTTDAEATYSGVTAFNSNGFSLGSDNGGNQNAATYVGWQWQAGQGSTSSNTNGSITSTVSVNATAGFSVVSYTGTGSNATVGHGLGVAPSFIIGKKRSSTGNWQCWHSAFTGTQYISLNLTTSVNTNSTVFNGAPTSTIFNIGTDTDLNASGATNVAYCWAEIAGFSKAFSYTGNGSADGSFIYLGFKPKFIIYKRTDSAGGWFMVDATRNPYNLANYWLQANTSDAEQTDGAIDLLSNGYKIRGTGTGTNANGGTYVGMAFSENPFKNSLAR